MSQSVKINLQNAKMNLVQCLFDEIHSHVNDMDLELSLLCGSFLKVHGFDGSSNEYKIFYSSYRDEIFDLVQQKLYNKGIDCIIQLDIDSKRIEYSAKFTSSGNLKKVLFVLIMAACSFKGYSFIVEEQEKVGSEICPVETPFLKTF